MAQTTAVIQPQPVCVERSHVLLEETRFWPELERERSSDVRAPGVQRASGSVPAEGAALLGLGHVERLCGGAGVARGNGEFPESRPPCPRLHPPWEAGPGLAVSPGGPSSRRQGRKRTSRSPGVRDGHRQGRGHRPCSLLAENARRQLPLTRENGQFLGFRKTKTGLTPEHRGIRSLKWSWYTEPCKAREGVGSGLCLLSPWPHSREGASHRPGMCGRTRGGRGGHLCLEQSCVFPQLPADGSRGSFVHVGRGPRGAEWQTVLSGYKGMVFLAQPLRAPSPDRWRKSGARVRPLCGPEVPGKGVGE